MKLFSILLLFGILSYISAQEKKVKKYYEKYPNGTIIEVTEQQQEQTITYPEEYELQTVYINPVYYEYTPIIYTIYEPADVVYYDFIDYAFIEPEKSVDIYYRKAIEKAIDQNEEKILKNIVDTEKEEIFGNINKNTQNLRKDNKIYNRKWLEAQFRISKAIYLEDRINALKEKEDKENNENKQNK